MDVELHVHGQVTIPQAPDAPVKRKDRLILGVARQICGLPPLPTAPGVMKKKSMDILQRFSGRSTPAHSPTISTSDILVEEPELIDLDTPSAQSVRSDLSRSSSRSNLTLNHRSSSTLSMDKYSPPGRSYTLPSRPSSSSLYSPTKSTWKNSHHFPLLDLATCHANLTERLAPFIARSVVGRLVTIRVYATPPKGDLDSRNIILQKQFLTDDHGHFTGRLIITPPRNSTPPDTWTITATLSTRGSPIVVRQDVKFIPEHGISLISDIDDTVKHTSVLSGARELFRNTFVRDLSSMSIEGVKEWYSRLTTLGVQIHYVSNSPYQCWPIINSFMSAAGLPPGGSVHLKQYSGMIAGILESPAEKKRARVETIIRDFPNRKFILVGDSGEQDLELYTEIAVNYQAQILGIFIRDVTTPLLTRTSSSSSLSMPFYFDTNGQPAQRQGRLAQLKSFKESWRTKSQGAVPTLSSFEIKDDTEIEAEAEAEAEAETDIDQLTLKELDLLSPLIMKAESAGEGVLEDLHNRGSKTPPAVPCRPQRIPSSSSIRSINSEPGGDFGHHRTNTEEQCARVKRVENWKRRLARSRDKLMIANSGVEI